MFNSLYRKYKKTLQNWKGDFFFQVAMVKYFFTTFILILQSNYYLCFYERFKIKISFVSNVTYPFVFCFREGQERKIEFMTLKEKVKRNFVKINGQEE